MRRGKYWQPNPDRLARAEAKRERRKNRNVHRAWSEVLGNKEYTLV